MLQRGVTVWSVRWVAMGLAAVSASAGCSSTDGGTVMPIPPSDMTTTPMMTLDGAQPTGAAGSSTGATGAASNNGLMGMTNPTGSMPVGGGMATGPGAGPMAVGPSGMAMDMGLDGDAGMPDMVDGMQPGQDMNGAAGDMAVGPTSERMPPCIDDDDSLFIVGDSYVDWPLTHTFLPDFKALSGRDWQSYAVGGASMASGGITGLIPDQYTRAIAEHPNAKAIVMTGGGNDILIPDYAMYPDAGQCTATEDSASREDCKAIVQMAVDKARSLISEAADDGVQDVVYFFYPEIPGGGFVGTKPNYILHYALPLAREVCESAEMESDGRLRCHFVDTVPAFSMQDGLFADAVSESGDGIHPNSKGSKVIAAEVWKVMQEACVGQPSSSGCCEKP